MPHVLDQTQNAQVTRKDIYLEALAFKQCLQVLASDLLKQLLGFLNDKGAVVLALLKLTAEIFWSVNFVIDDIVHLLLGQM